MLFPMIVTNLKSSFHLIQIVKYIISIFQWLELKKSHYKCPCCRNDMLTNDELREAATDIVENGIANNTNGNGDEIGDDDTNNNNGHASIPAQPRRRRGLSLLRPAPLQRNRIFYRPRTYSDESPVFIPDL